MYDRSAYGQRVQWFRDARFGLFVHWGAYAVPARGEWVRSSERLSLEDYQPFVDAFQPDAYDPAQWARLARQAGMKYAVLTAKHHDGFCLFDSALTDYKARLTGPGRDLVRDFLDAFRAEGLKVGLYYSLLDWQHPDYPHFGDRQHPMRDNEAYRGRHHDFDRYLNYMHGQVRELCTNYGQIDIFWFDFSYDNPDRPMRGEAWRAAELLKMIRQYQPQVLIDNRLEVSGEGFGSLMTDEPTPWAGDFVSPEQIIPPEGLIDHRGRPLTWEACVTMNNHWGYNAFDRHFKPAGMLIRKLVECVSKGGNLLLNVGPDARGRIPPESVQILEEIGAWMALNAESVHGCGRADLPKPDFGRVTAKGKTPYYHVLDNPLGYVPLCGLKPESIASVSLLHTGAALPVENNWITANYPDTAFVSLGPDPRLPIAEDTVLKVVLKEGEGT